MYVMYKHHKEINHRKHQNILYTLVIIVIVLQIGFIVVVSFQVTGFNYKLDKTEKNLSQYYQSLLEDYKKQNQAEINDLALALAAQEAKQDSVEDAISKLKVSQADFSGIIENSLKSVVGVVTESSLGTGFVVNNEGYIVTNEHVISDAKRIRALTYDKRAFNATLIVKDSTRDIALLKIEEDFPQLQLADSNELQIGEKVIAIGNPLGLSFSVSEGIISALDRRGPSNLREYIQTDVSLNPGNSGGPLINTEGEVVGMNNFKISDTEGLGFALESNSIRETINKLTNQTIIA